MLGFERARIERQREIDCLTRRVTNFSKEHEFRPSFTPTQPSIASQDIQLYDKLQDKPPYSLSWDRHRRRLDQQAIELFVLASNSLCTLFKAQNTR